MAKFFCKFPDDPSGNAFIAKFSDESFTLLEFSPLSEGIRVLPVGGSNAHQYCWEIEALGFPLFCSFSDTNDNKAIIPLFKEAITHIKEAVIALNAAHLNS